MKKTIKVTGMHCSSCEVLLSEAVEEAGVRVLSASHKSGELVVEVPSEAALMAARKAIENEGYTPNQF